MGNEIVHSYDEALTLLAGELSTENCPDFFVLVGWFGFPCQHTVFVTWSDFFVWPYVGAGVWVRGMHR